MFDLTSLVPVLFPLIIAVSAYLYHYLVQRSPANIQKLITSLAETVVPAIEQIGTTMSSASKKATALQNIQSILKGLHVTIPTQLIDLAIESAVHDLNLYSPKKQEIPDPAPINVAKVQAQIFIPADIPPAA